MSTTLTSSALPGTPAPKNSAAFLEDPFAWTNDATYVTVPVGVVKSEVLEALLRRSMLVVEHVAEELARESTLRTAVRAVAGAAGGAKSLVASRVHPARAEGVGATEYPDDVVVRTVHPGTEALDQLQDWLALPLDEIVAVVGLSGSTRQFWRNNPTAVVRPSKAGRLLRFRTAVGLLVGSIGLERARHVLHDEGWLRPLDEVRLVALEARVREQLSPGPLLAPPGLEGLSREQLLAASAPSGEAEQRRSESARDTAPVLPLSEDVEG